ncbi:MAG: entericidin A/B family lipoprotein [Alphaproteobacteria bacterium]|nr:MAG: entericidin A/B family lipoprotein [Alphaproteobacteria bacterium]
MGKTIRIFTAALFLVSVLSVSGCNTMQGVGEDFKAAGEAISGSAADNKGY